MHVFLLIISLLISEAAFEPCDICKNLVNEFNNGLKESEKSNFGGGNTAWEERRLGNFATSETRLIHILENLCPSSVTNRDKCQYLREEVEEKIEDWWFNYFRKDQTLRNLFEFLCVDKIKICCPDNHFGESCNKCLYFDATSQQFCNGHGNCDGNGTRHGNGTCLCHTGYMGDQCDSCIFAYYSSENGCNSCPMSCSGCNGPTDKDCLNCSSGFLSFEGACKDIDECVEENVNCTEGTYCFNTYGNYDCKACDKSCLNCTGEGSDKCIQCNDGYQSVGYVCEDVNECSADSALCRGVGEKCTNIPGSYECSCEEDYTKDSQSGKCVRRESEARTIRSTDDL